MTFYVSPSARRATHPLDVDLVAWVDRELDGQATGEVDAHLGRCARCREIVDNVAAPFDGQPALESVPTSTAFRFTGDVAPQPGPGEVWALEWGGGALLAVVTGGADTAAVQVVPVVAEDPNDSAVNDTESGRFHAAPTGAVTVPLGVFRERVAGPDRVEAASDNVAVTWASALLWAVSTAALERTLRLSWLPPGGPQVTLEALVRQRGLRPRQLAERTGITPASLTELLRADRPPTPDEAGLLADVLDVEPGELLGVEIPAALAWAVERPTNRARIRRRAESAGRSEAEQRVIEARAVMAVPARTTTRVRDVDTWDELLGHHLGD